MDAPSNTGSIRQGHLAPRGPQVAASVHVFQSIGGIVDAAAQTAAAVVDDLGALEGVPDPLRGKLRQLCDAVYDLDYRMAPNGD